jgi:hypothetical protein
MATAGLLFALGLLCLVGTILALVFTIISFANNKSTKYTWLTILLICIIGLVFSIVTFVNKAVKKVESLAEEASETFQNYTDSLSQQMSDSLNIDQYQLLSNNEQIKLLKDYSIQNNSENVPEQFYTYLGFGNYFRYPLTYPYSLHCNLFKDDGELFNEENVVRFDENDNGERSLNIENIKKIAFDNKWLLVEYMAELRETNKTEMRFVLFSFEDAKRTDCNSEKELYKTAIQKGYKGNKKLISIEDYNLLFQ